MDVRPVVRHPERSGHGGRVSGQSGRQAWVRVGTPASVDAARLSALRAETMRFCEAVGRHAKNATKVALATLVLQGIGYIPTGEQATSCCMSERFEFDEYSVYQWLCKSGSLVCMKPNHELGRYLMMRVPAAVRNSHHQVALENFASVSCPCEGFPAACRA